MPGKLDSHLQKGGVGLLATSVVINLKWVRDLHLSAKAVKFSEETCINLHEFGCGKEFLDVSQKNLSNKRKKQKNWTSKLKMFVLQRTLSRQCEVTPEMSAFTTPTQHGTGRPGHGSQTKQAKGIQTAKEDDDIILYRENTKNSTKSY